MGAARRFLQAESIWAAGILLLLVPLVLLDGDPPAGVRFVRWLARAITLAAFPAGITVARLILAGLPDLRPMLRATLAAAGVSLAVFVVMSAGAPMFGEPAITTLARTMTDAAASWEQRNDAAWDFYEVLFAPVHTLLFALIGIQAGLWANFGLPLFARRAVYWTSGIGLLVTEYAVADTTYEAIVIRTAADVSFAGFYPLLIPAGVCAGLALPTLALLWRSRRPAAPAE